MLRIVLASSAAFVITAPALAQTAAPAAAVPPAPVEATAQPAPEETPAPQAASVEAVVTAEFPAFDADKSGDLNVAEFGKWILALRDKDTNAPKLDAAARTKWAQDMFGKADANKDKKIAKAEMVALFSGNV